LISLEFYHKTEYPQGIINNFVGKSASKKFREGGGRF